MSFGTVRRNRRFRRRLAAGAVLCVLVASCVLAVAWMANSPQTRVASPPEETTESHKEKTVTEKPRLLTAAQSCDDLDILMDPRHPLPADYAPQDLVYLSGYGVALLGGDLPLRREAAENLGRLSSAAVGADEEALVASAYRSYAEQEATFAHYTGIYGDWATHVSAPPGESQHQLGTTVDFTNSEVAYQLIPTFGNTSASMWLEDNAWRYGYINTYPEEDAGTGRQAEPWEYRYVGVERARAVNESGLSLREFLRKNGQAPCS